VSCICTQFYADAELTPSIRFGRKKSSLVAHRNVIGLKDFTPTYLTELLTNKQTG
jgi:hypothetical protein